MNARIELRYNVVTNRDLKAVGVSGTEISRAVNCCLIRLCAGVYSIAAACGRPQHKRIGSLITDTEWTDYFRTTSGDERARDRQFTSLLARLATIHYRSYRSADVVAGASAALLHDLPMFDLALRPLTVMHPTASTRSTAVRRLRRAVPAEDREAIGRLTVTSAVRTGLDLIEFGGPVSGFAALETVLRRSVTAANGGKALAFSDSRKVRELGSTAVEAEVMPAVRGMSRGSTRAQRIVERISPMSESYAESRCSFNLHTLGLHDFVQQWNVAADGELLTRLDFLHRATMTALAVDGSGKYEDAGRGRLRHESYQHNMLLKMGYTVVHFTFHDILNPQVFGLKLFEQAPRLLEFRIDPLVL